MTMELKKSRADPDLAVRGSPEKRFRRLVVLKLLVYRIEDGIS